MIELKDVTKLRKLINSNADDYELGTVLRWKTRYINYGKTKFTYGAIKTVKGWYVTGNRAGDYTLSNLISQFLISNDKQTVSKIQVAWDWADVK